MAIIDLKTNLKSLKYESGNAPFVTKDINNPPSTSRVGSEITRRVDDVVRVTKAILPENSRFLENQAKLQSISFSKNVDGIKVAQGKTTAGAIIQQVVNSVVSTAKIAASTIAQTAAAGTGLHIVRGFETKEKKAYGNEAMSNGKVVLPDPGEQSDLKLAFDITSLNTTGTTTPYLETTKDSSSNKTTAGLAVESGGKVLIPSQPPSKIFDEWLINRFTEKSTVQNYNLPKDNETARSQFIINPNDNLQEFGLPLILTANNPSQTLKIRDFRKDKPGSISFDYNSPTINKEQRVGLGNKGYWGKPADYSSPTYPTAIDKLNATDVSLNQLDGVGVGATSVRDLVKFRFEVLAPGQNPRFLYFRALLENLDDNYTGTWSDTNYVGRGDAVRTYNGFSRDISLSFKIVATTRDEMKPLYKKMVYLASTTAPTYGEGGSFMKGTLVRMTVGSYLYEVAGTMNSVKYNWRENYPWEIAMQNPENNIDDDMQELPHIMDCSINFTPIHDFVPQTGLYHYITSPRLSGNAKPFFYSGAQQ